MWLDTHCHLDAALMRDFLHSLQRGFAVFLPGALRAPQAFPDIGRTRAPLVPTLAAPAQQLFALQAAGRQAFSAQCARQGTHFFQPGRIALLFGADFAPPFPGVGQRGFPLVALGALPAQFCVDVLEVR